MLIWGKNSKISPNSEKLRKSHMLVFLWKNNSKFKVMPRFPHIYDIKQYWIQKIKEMWFWVYNFKICQKSPKTGIIYVTSHEIFRLMEITGAKWDFLHFHWGYIDTKHPAKLFCLILPNKGIVAIFVIFKISKI